MTTEATGLLVLGLGNVLCGDDGLGVAALARLDRGWTAPREVRLMDGGTLGMTLLHWVGEADSLLIVDAIRADGPPGTLVRLTGDQVAPAIESRLSVHQVGVADLLDALRWTDSAPKRIVLLGIVPQSIELGLGLSPAVGRAVADLVDAVLDEARDQGFAFTRRETDELCAGREPGLAPRALGL